MMQVEKNKPGKYCGGRPKSEFRTASKENYKRFKAENPSIDISFKEYDALLRSINLEYSIRILETGNVVKLPYGLGGLSINKKKGKKIYSDGNGDHICLPVNWKETLKEKKVIYHFNEHTDGFHCKWYWIKSMSKIKYKEIWSFRICKKNSQLLTAYCFNTEKKYYLKYHEFNLKKK